MFSAFWIGLAGAGHCLSMCSGILGVACIPGPQGKPSNWNFLFIQVGRICGYLLVGTTLAALLHWFEWQTPFSMLLPSRYFALFMMLGLAFYLIGWPQLLSPFEILGQQVWLRLQPLLHTLLPVEKAHQAFRVGILWGWLPCGMVYAVAALAMSTARPVHGALVMLSFGLGTLPAIYSAHALFAFFCRHARTQTARQIGGFTVLLSAGLSWYLMGISSSTAHIH